MDQSLSIQKNSTPSSLRVTVSVAMLLSALVVVLGAYTRLVDAGLGCPDWPGCYGFLTVPQTEADLARSTAAYPCAPVEAGKAWTEMIHRYFASILGLVVISLPLIAWKTKQPMILPSILAVLVIVQGAFGAWTVTLKLWPQVVTAHLLGGFATLAILFYYLLLLNPKWKWRVSPRASRVAHVTLAFLVLQIALGGWTSSNYAALACPDFPTCHGEFFPPMNFVEGFDVFQDIGPNYLGGEMSSEARAAIQMAHRMGAFVVLGVAFWTAALLNGGLRWTLTAVVSGQFLLGASNVLLNLPLSVALLHHAGAAALLLVLVAVLVSGHKRHSYNPRETMEFMSANFQHHQRP